MVQITDNPLLLLPALFALAFIVQMVYYLGIYSAIVFYRDKSQAPNQYPPVSVIICAKNEEVNLERHLPLILEQDYPEFEVVVVNHGSADDTDMVLTRYQNQYGHLKFTELQRDQKFNHNKKLAVALGIKKASYEWLLFTDADCYPAGRNWIRSMAGRFDQNTSLVLGYGGYEAQGGWLNKLIRLDTLTIALQYFSYALRGIPYMGVGRNLAYRKSLFFNNKGFAGHYHLQSGDDDLFVNQTAHKHNTRIQINQEAKIISKPHQSFDRWFFQKKRHLTTSPHYKKQSRFLLLTEVFSRLAFYGAFVLSLVYWPEGYPFLLTIFGIRLMLQIFDYKSFMNRVGEKNLLLLVIFYDILLPFINFMGIISNKIASNNTKWT